MAKARRTFTDEDKAKILAHNAEHGPKVTAGHFNIHTSMINRWKRQAQPVKQKGKWGPGKKKWSDEKVAGVLDFLKTHSNGETMRHFKISSSQISLWRRGLSHGHYKARRKAKANGAQPVTNGLGELPERDALKWLEIWRQAYFDRMKAETPSATTVLAALRGGK